MLVVRHLSVPVASSWGTKEEEREEEGGGGGEGKGRKQEGRGMRIQAGSPTSAPYLNVVGPMADVEGWVMLAGI